MKSNHEKADHHPCEDCRFRARAEQRPNTFLARLWRWHTTWCPGWKSYQRWLVEHPGR